jgi:hypothetical protein
MGKTIHDKKSSTLRQEIVGPKHEGQIHFLINEFAPQMEDEIIVKTTKMVTKLSIAPDAHR